MAEKDIEQILVSSEKVTRRGREIGSIGLVAAPKPEPLPALPFEDPAEPRELL